MRYASGAGTFLALFICASPPAVAQEPRDSTGDSLKVYDFPTHVVWATKEVLGTRSPGIRTETYRPDTSTTTLWSSATDWGKFGLHQFVYPTGSGAETSESRGFATAGETQYFSTFLNGIPLTESYNSRFDLQYFDMRLAERTEFTDGSLGYLHGNSTWSGVVNYLINPGAAQSTRFWLLPSVERESRLGVSLPLRIPKVPGVLSASYLNRSPDRDHSQAKGGTGVLSFQPASTPTSQVTVTALGLARSQQYPGPIPEEVFYTNRDTSLTPDDQLEAVTVGVGANGQHRLSPQVIAWNVFARWDDRDESRTLFGQTELQNLNLGEYGGEGRFETPILGVTSQLYSTTGISARLADLNSTYYDGGFPATGAPLDRVDVTGAMGAVYQRFKFPIGSSLTASLAARYDYHYFEPDSGSIARFDAFSPAVAMSVAPAKSAVIDLALMQTFRAPTIAQLYDNRPVSVYDPYSGGFISLKLSSEELQPQVARLVTLSGDYQAAASTHLGASVYYANVRDEIDFDLAQLRYDNIGSSIHWGADLSAQVDFNRFLAVSATAEWNRTTYGDDDRSGKLIPGIPGLVGALSMGVRPGAGLTITGSLAAVSEMYLDESNQRTLPGYIELQGLISYQLRQLQFLLGVDNLLGGTHPAYGYMDPLSGSAMLFPTQPRSIRFGVAGDLR